jgi:hypothetical protein
MIPRGTVADDCALYRAIKKRLNTTNAESNFVTVCATVPVWPNELGCGVASFDGAASAAGCWGLNIVPILQLKQAGRVRKKVGRLSVLAPVAILHRKNAAMQHIRSVAALDNVAACNPLPSTAVH